MWFPDRRQWWVLWIAAGVALVVWWHGAADVAFEPATNSPEWLQEKAEIVREQHEMPASAGSLANLLVSNQQERVDRALAIEVRSRTIGTMLVVGCLALWQLGSPRFR